MDLYEQNEINEQEEATANLALKKQLRKKAKEKSAKYKIEEKMAGKIFVKWAFDLMTSVILFPVSVIVLDVYWFATLINKKLYKLGIGWGMALALCNFVLLIIIIIAMPLIYCIIEPVECGLEIAEEAVKATVETATGQ